MTHHYRIIKYNPDFRDERGAYLKDEWTCFSDIGKVFNGNILLFKEYHQMETLYLNAVIKILDYLNIDSLYVKHFYNIPWAIQTTSIYEGKKLFISEIELVIRNICRNNRYWAHLVTKDFYFHFSEEFYMYIGSRTDYSPIIPIIESSGLFVDKISKSPYLDDPEDF